MTWTVIADSEIDQDSPITETLMTALRDNLPSAFAGDSGAPKLQAAALETGAAETSWVAARMAGVSAGGVGTYALLRETGTDRTTRTPGATVAGSALDYAALVAVDNGAYSSGNYTGSPSGTWRLMGAYSTSSAFNDSPISLWLRIS